MFMVFSFFIKIQKFLLLSFLLCIFVTAQKVSPTLWVQNASDLSFTDLPGRTEGSSFQLNGLSAGKKIGLYLKKEGCSLPEQSHYQIPDSRGRFHFDVGFPYGPGIYTVTVSVQKKGEDDTFWLLSEFKITSEAQSGSYKTRLNYYDVRESVSRNHFKLDPVEFENDYNFILKGKTGCKNLSFHVKKFPEGSSYQIDGHVKANSRFFGKIPAKNGPGIYKITVYGEFPKPGESGLNLIGSLFLKAQKEVPDDYNEMLRLTSAKPGADKLLIVNPLKKKWGYKFTLTGTTEMPDINMWLSISKEGQFCEEVAKIDEDGNFTFEHFFRFGPGEYTVNFWGFAPGEPLDEQELFTFTVVSEKPLPPSYGRPTPVTFYYGGRQNRLNLDLIPSETSGVLSVSGVTGYDVIQFEISNKTKRVPHYAYEAGYIDAGRFLWTLRPPWGDGEYFVTVYGYPGTDGNVKNQCASFETTFFNASGNLKQKGGDRQSELNSEMVEYIEKNIGNVIGGGDCEDLVRDFFYRTGAMWIPHDEVGPDDPRLPVSFDSPASKERFADIALPEYGRRIDPSKEKLKPGDITLYFMAVFHVNGKEHHVTSHVSVLYENIESKKWKIAHQGFAGQKEIVVTTRNFDDYASGVLRFYRPVKGITFSSR